MTKIVATFSNGHRDPYKGKRPVTAAWMVITPDGVIHSGHSNNLPTADKTARTYAAERFRSDEASRAFHYQSLKAMAKWMHMQRRVGEILRATGFKNVKEHDAALAAARAAFVARCRIEVVDLGVEA